MNLAPIVLFVYNRPWHTLQTLEALTKNYLASESILYIYADGVENFLPEVEEKVNKTREVIRKQKWCKEVFIIEASENKGLAASIVSGVTEVVNKHGKIIVLEDDIVTSAGFLTYMNEALTMFAKEDLVSHISGYMYPVSNRLEDGTVFLKILSCWGWGTWKRAWENYSNDLSFFMEKLRDPKEIKKFNIDGDAPFYDQLVSNYSGELRSWAVRWYASWYFKGHISLFPKTSLVRNIGNDGTGTNSTKSNNYEAAVVADRITVEEKDFIEDQVYLEKINAFYKEEKKHNKGSASGLQVVLRMKRVMMRSLSTIVGKLIQVYLLHNERPLIKTQTDILSKSFLSNKAKLYSPYTITDSYIDDYTYIAHNSVISKTKIGKFCSIGPNFMCGRGIHPTNGLSTSPMFYSTMKQNGVSLSSIDKEIERKPIIIGNDVFIGMNVTILDGISIGDGAVIGAGATVSKNIPPYAIAVGNPVKIVRHRFDETTISRLLKIEWWNFEEVRLKEVEKRFYEVEKFIEENLPVYGDDNYKNMD